MKDAWLNEFGINYICEINYISYIFSKYENSVTLKIDFSLTVKTSLKYTVTIHVWRIDL